ncbi:PH domain-containing protein [Candidatus Microgenomates bacterium]|nr:MAG: PH domain-containing protein [Candidatus Microgenomates bacterium]
MPEVFSTKPDQPKNSSHDAIQPRPKANGRKTSFKDMAAAFLERPKDIVFETQAKDEEIVLFLRQHFVVNAGWILFAVFLFLLPGFILPALLSSSTLVAAIPAGYFVVLPLLWYTGIFGFVLASFLHWYFNVYIVTDRRIVDIDWINLLYKMFSSTSLDKIQDVNLKQGGITEIFFNFGDVFIQTAGSEQNFEFKAVPRANEVVSEINELVHK